MGKLTGGCYCGNISLLITSPEDLTKATPRACSCGFCTSHGAEWVSAPNATLEITIQNEAATNIFTQGSESARFWLCQCCGVVTAVTCDIDGKRKGAVNRLALTEKNSFPTAQSINPQSLNAAEKRARWSELWINDVVIKDCWE